MTRLHEFDFATNQPYKFEHRVSEDGVTLKSQSYEFHASKAISTEASLRTLTSLEEDLRDVIVALYLADRSALRKPEGKIDRDGVFWSRKLYVRIGVRNVEQWDTTAVREALREYLYFTTGDTWILEFVERPSWQSEHHQLELLLKRRNLPVRHPNWSVALCSEGGDSWAGLSDQLSLNPDTNFLLVTHNSNRRIMQMQRQLLDAMPMEARARVRPASFSVTRGGLHDEQSESENSSRTRGLLFLGGGTLAALSMGLEELWIFENGIGAFNFAFDATQLIGQATRSVHPHSLALFSRFVGSLLRIRFSIKNPYQFQTKAEMWHALDKPGWRQLIPMTFTCGHEYRVANGGHWHCGVCTSCVLRRGSLRAANMWREDTPRYVHDLSRLDEVPFKKRGEWEKVRNQMRLITKCLNAGDQNAVWNAVVGRWHEIFTTMNSVCADGSLSHIKFQQGVMQLLAQYHAEGLAIGPTALQNLPQSRDIATTLSLFDADSAVRAA